MRLQNERKITYGYKLLREIVDNQKNLSKGEQAKKNKDLLNSFENYLMQKKEAQANWISQHFSLKNSPPQKMKKQKIMQQYIICGNQDRPPNFEIKGNQSRGNKELKHYPVNTIGMTFPDDQFFQPNTTKTQSFYHNNSANRYKVRTELKTPKP